MMPMLKVYLAGPDVFFPDKFDIPRQKKDELKKYGMEGLYPLDNEIANFGKTQEVGFRIGVLNFQMIDSADVVLANMVPFRGPSMDVGTVAEIAYAFAKGKLVVGYYPEPTPLLKERTIAHYNNKVTEKNGEILDPNGHTIEEFEMPENLMVPTAIRDSGGQIFYSFTGAVSKIQDLWKLKQKVPELQLAQ